MAKKPKKDKSANVTVMMYDGQLDTIFECVGVDKCAYARFYTNPPEPDEECSCCRPGMSCANAAAVKPTLERLRGKIDELLEEFAPHNH